MPKLSMPKAKAGAEDRDGGRRSFRDTDFRKESADFGQYFGFTPSTCPFASNANSNRSARRSYVPPLLRIDQRIMAEGADECHDLVSPEQQSAVCIFIVLPSGLFTSNSSRFPRNRIPGSYSHVRKSWAPRADHGRYVSSEILPTQTL
jgi:hypothetical protein